MTEKHFERRFLMRGSFAGGALAAGLAYGVFGAHPFIVMGIAVLWYLVGGAVDARRLEHSASEATNAE